MKNDYQYILKLDEIGDRLTYKKFELYKLYSTEGKIKYGLEGNGYHFCKYLEDTLRYYDAMNDEVNKRDYKSNEEWKADQAKVTATYMESVPYLEKSLELRPNDFTTVETLKVLTFRLRDEEGMMPKYEKYNKAFEALKAN